MTTSNSINIVLLERCHHPLVGPLPDHHALDEPLDRGQVRMLRHAVDVMLVHLSPDARGVLQSMSGGKHIVPDAINVGTARRLSGLLDHLWQRTPEEKREKLQDWFRCFNSSPARRTAPRVASKSAEAAGPDMSM